MGIRFNCDACQRNLHVKDYLAGKRAVCPHCGASIKIPLESTRSGSSKRDKSGENDRKSKAHPAPAQANTADARSGATQPQAASPVANAKNDDNVGGYVGPTGTMIGANPMAAMGTENPTPVVSSSSPQESAPSQAQAAPAETSQPIADQNQANPSPLGTVTGDFNAKQTVIDPNPGVIARQHQVDPTTNTPKADGNNGADPLGGQGPAAAQMGNPQAFGETLAAGYENSGPTGTLVGGLGVHVPEPAPEPEPEPKAQDPIDESPESVWYVRPLSGGQFGPAAGPLMRRWIEEGRVAPTSFVWREGWEDWKAATEAFPYLVSAPPENQNSPDIKSKDPAPPVPQAVPATPAQGQPVMPQQPQQPQPSQSTHEIDHAANKVLAYRRQRSRSQALAVGVIVVLTLISLGLMILLYMLVAS